MKTFVRKMLLGGLSTFLMACAHAQRCPAPTPVTVPADILVNLRSLLADGCAAGPAERMEWLERAFPGSETSMTSRADAYQIRLRTDGPGLVSGRQVTLQLDARDRRDGHATRFRSISPTSSE